MLTALGLLYSFLFFVLAVFCWVFSFLGMPALWLLVLFAVLNSWLIPESYLVHVPWRGVFVLIVLGLCGELVEFLAGALGVGKLGGSRRAAVLSLVGSFLGAIVGIFVSIPIPIPLLGALVSSLLFSGLGAMGGAWLGEYWFGKDTKTGLKVGLAAFVGRIVGTIGKSIFGAVMVGVVLVLVFS